MKRLDSIERYSLLAAKSMLTIDEAAAFTNISKGYLYKLTSCGKVPFYKPNGKTIYFAKDELTAWLKQNRHNTTDEAEAEAAAYLIKKGGMA